jgi:hypothetical protein
MTRMSVNHWMCDSYPPLPLLFSCPIRYCPSVFILKPGELVHINKGRLHAFRKLSPHQLPTSDCHAELRAHTIANQCIEMEEICVSVAWVSWLAGWTMTPTERCLTDEQCFSFSQDWMYRGITAAGINREITSTLECAALNRKHEKHSLAIPELSLLQMARTIAPSLTPSTVGSVGGLAFGSSKSASSYQPVDPTVEEVCRGILPSLDFVVQKHLLALEKAEATKGGGINYGERVTVAERPNSHENPSLFPVDPYGNGDFFCKLCLKELSNVYFHCDGCEVLLSKDFNICQECHAEKKSARLIMMHPTNPKRHSTVNHTGTHSLVNSCLFLALSNSLCLAFLRPE